VFVNRRSDPVHNVGVRSTPGGGGGKRRREREGRSGGR